MSETVILFMTHYLSGSILNEFYSLKRSHPAGARVRMLYDNSKKDFDASAFADQADYYLYDLEDVAANYPILNPSKRAIVPGNCIFPMLLYAENNGGFNHLWRVEYDARFTGDWAFFFDSFIGNESDLLGTTIFRYDFRPSWNWWTSLKTPVGPLEKKSLLRGFFPVFRLSKKACDILIDSYHAGWRGHDEVSIPTILNFYGCSIEDMGGTGEFVKPENRNRFYTNTPDSQGLAPGTFVSASQPDDYPNVPNMLYHPVKE